MKKFLSIPLLTLSYLQAGAPFEYCVDKGDEKFIGYDEGFFFQPNHDAFSLKINGLTQNRFVVDYRSDTPTSSPHQTSYGFENTRNALNFSGHLSTLGFYNLRLEIGAYTSGLIVDWGFGGLAFPPGLSLACGLMRIPSLREWVIQDEYQLAIARGYTTAIFDRKTPAIQLGYEGRSWRVNSYVGNGLAQNVHTHNQTMVPEDLSLSYVHANNTWLGALRLEWLVYQTQTEYCIPGSGPDASGRLTTGRWAAFNQFTYSPQRPCGLLLGAFASYTTLKTVDHSLERDLNHERFFQVTADLQMQFTRGSLYSAIWVIPSHTTTYDTEADTAWGLLLQTSGYATKKLEFYFRYETARWNKNILLSMSHFPEKYSYIGTLGFNYYFIGQNLKLSTDIGCSGKPLHNNLHLTQANSTDWLNDFSSGGGQLLTRIQLQAFF